MTSEELDALRENTIASNQRTLASLMQLQAKALQIQAEQTEKFNNIKAILVSVLERLDRLEQLNQRAIGFATRDS